MLLGKMLIGVFGSAVAAAWVGSGLVANMFRAKAHRREGHCMVAFGTGQPLAFYGSWPLFTLAHHNTVWLSAELVDPEKTHLPFSEPVTILSSEMQRWLLCTRRWWPWPRNRTDFKLAIKSIHLRIRIRAMHSVTSASRVHIQRDLIDKSSKESSIE